MIEKLSFIIFNDFLSHSIWRFRLKYLLGGLHKNVSIFAVVWTMNSIEFIVPDSEFIDTRTLKLAKIDTFVKSVIPLFMVRFQPDKNR